jgi:hypothetical protein
MDIMSSVAAINAAIKSAKDLKDIHELASSAEAKLKIADIQLALSDARIALSEARERIHELEKQIIDSDSHSAEIFELDRDGIFFKDKKNGLLKCPTCIESNKKIITLVPDRPNKAFEYRCNNCSSIFRNPHWREESLDGYNWRSRELP